MTTQYIGKCLLISEGNERILVIGDVHLGYGGREIGGVDLGKQVFEDMIEDFERIFEKIDEGKVDKIILLGDLKHEFSSLIEEEREGIVNLFDYLQKKTREIVVIRGNHDNYLLGILAKRGVRVWNYYLWKEFCFLHGNRDFPEIYDKKTKCWVMGHLHPAISLQDGVKVERYKCFLEGEYKKKRVIILPSFIEAGEGVDVLTGESNLAWDFDFGKFKVLVVGEKGEVLDFGRVSDLR